MAYRTNANPVNGGYTPPANPVNGGYTPPANPANGGYTPPANPVNGRYTPPANPANGGYTPAEPLYIPREMSLRNVKDFLMQNGNVKLLFTLVIDGIIIHGVSAVPSPDGYYLALPKRKGSDGKWYSIVYINLSDDVKNYIIDMAWKEIEKLHSAR